MATTSTATTTPSSRGGYVPPSQGGASTNGSAPGSAGNTPSNDPVYAGGNTDDSTTYVRLTDTTNGPAGTFQPDPNHPGSFMYDPVASVSSLMAHLFQASPDEIKKIQSMLVGMNLLSPKELTPGQPDERTVSAYHTLLIRSSLMNRSPEAVARDAISALGPNSGGVGAGSPFSPVVTNPTDIKAAVDAYAPQTLGHDLTDAEKEKLVALYQQVQTSAQKANYDANISGGTSTAPPALDSFVQQQATALHPQDAVDYGNLLQARTFMNMIGNFQGSQG